MRFSVCNKCSQLWVIDTKKEHFETFVNYLFIDRYYINLPIKEDTLTKMIELRKQELLKNFLSLLSSRDV